jgi:hypothetical protein
MFEPRTIRVGCARAHTWTARVNGETMMHSAPRKLCSWSRVWTWGPQGQGVRGVKTMVKSVGGWQIPWLEIVWKKVRRC